MAGALTIYETDFATSTLQANLFNTLPISGGVTGQNRPVTAMNILNDGNLVAGTYYITFSSVTPGVSGVAVVNTSDSNNPWKTAGTGVTFDDSQTTPGTGTQHKTLIGGLGLYFSNSASFASNWAANIIVGGYFSSGAAIPVSSFGAVLAGNTTSNKKIGIKNTGDANCEGCTLGIYPGSYFKNTTNTPVHKIKVTSKTATVGKYALTTENYAAGHTDVNIARYSYNYTTQQWTLESGPTFKGNFVCDSATEITGGIITGVSVTLSNTITSNSAANIYIESTSGAQIAPDSSGVPGTWVTSSDVTLTDTDNLSGGVIQPNHVAYAWVRVVTSVSDNIGNVRKFTLRPLGTSVGQPVE